MLWSVGTRVRFSALSRHGVHHGTGRISYMEGEYAHVMDARGHMWRVRRPV